MVTAKRALWLRPLASATTGVHGVCIVAETLWSEPVYCHQTGVSVRSQGWGGFLGGAEARVHVDCKP